MAAHFTERLRLETVDGEMLQVSGDDKPSLEFWHDRVNDHDQAPAQLLRDEVIVLRDYLTQWLTRCPE
jgi:hypothetical protein